MDKSVAVRPPQAIAVLSEKAMAKVVGKKFGFGIGVLGAFMSIMSPVAAQFSIYSGYDYPDFRTCEQVRTYRSQTRLNTRELQQIEYDLCVANRQYHNNSYSYYAQPVYINTPPISASQDCIDTTIMAKLAIASDPFSSQTNEILGFQQVMCSLPDLARSNRQLRWSNGRNAKFGNAWYYPSGKKALFGNSWYYPNGKSATFGNNWYYPNGRNARFGSFWYYPNGKSTNLTSLLSWSCRVLGQYNCQGRLADLQTASDFWYHLTVIELSSRAYAEYQYNRQHGGHSGGSNNSTFDIDIIIK